MPQEEVLQDAEAELLDGRDTLRAVAEDPSNYGVGAARVIPRVLADDPARGVEQLLGAHARGLAGLGVVVVSLQDLVHDAEPLVLRVVSVEPETGVRRVVEIVVELADLPVRELGDFLQERFHMESDAGAMHRDINSEAFPIKKKRQIQHCDHL